MTDNSNNFDSLQERNQQVLDNISQLQTQEKELSNRNKFPQPTKTLYPRPRIQSIELDSLPVFIMLFIG